MESKSVKQKFFTKDGKKIYPNSFVKTLRETEESKKDSKVFIAQEGAQEFGLSSSADICVFGGNRGGGKANSYATPVATPSGFRKMGELEVGDLICTPYDGIQRVSGIYEQGEQYCYVFHFDDGTYLTCMDNHRFWARVGAFGEFKEMEAREIMNNYVIGKQYPMSLRQNKTQDDYVEIPLCGEVIMNERMTSIDLPVHPFVLGYVSGTGYWHFARQGVQLCLDSYEARTLRNYGYCVRKNKDDNYYYLKGLDYRKRKEIVNRRVPTPAKIPEAYKTASIQARWEFLRGVMYKCGKSLKGHPYLDMPNKPFVEDLAQLARSLGIWARISKVEDEPSKIGYYRITFMAPDDRMLFERKYYRDQAHNNAEVPTNPYNTNILTKKIVQINRADEKQKCRCITVTGRDHLYMTNAFTINHNTVTMLMEPMYDMRNKHFNGIIFRRNKDDFENIINESARWFGNLGKYNKSKDDMTWNFKSGAKLGFWYYDMQMSDFDIKFRGQQFAYIGIDELPQMSFEMFKFIMTCCRNTYGVHSRILGTCNPDPLSWLRKFIDWWIGKEDTIYSDGKMHPERKGLPIPERDGVMRYCYMPDNSVDNIYWGNSPEEVYEQCKELIDDAWDDSWAEYGYTKTSFFVKSVTFVKAALSDNKALIKNDPGYIASLLNQPEEVRAREFEGNWDFIETGADMIKASHLNNVFSSAQQLGDKIRRATCDVAGTGGDNCVTWFWIGWHVADVFVCRRDPYTTAEMLKGKLQEWGVLEQNFAYDLNGMGQVLKGAFPKAVPFNNMEAVASKFKHMYDNIKSQCAYKFAERTQQTGWSIEPTLLQRKYKIGNNTRTLYDILQNERKCIKQDMSKADKGWCLIHKEQMKLRSVVGHSPDFVEALFMREVFDLKASGVTIPLFLQGKIRSHRVISRSLSSHSIYT